MKRRIVSLVLAAGMISALLGGCGGTESSSGTETGSSAAAEETDSDTLDLDTEITIKMTNSGGVVDDADRIEELINEITEEEIGVTVDIEWVDIGTYMEQINLMFSSQETCDLIMLMPTMYSSALNQNELMDITEYLDEYGQDIIDISGEYLDAFTYYEGIYGIPVTREKGGYAWVDMRLDILEELDLVEEAESMTCWTDYYELLAKVAEAYPDITPCYVSSANQVGASLDGVYYIADEDWSDAIALDNLGDSNNLVYVDEDGNVQSYYTSDLFYNSALRALDLFETGYVNTDAATNTDGGTVQCKNGQCFSWIASGESDNELTTSMNSEYEMLCVPIMQYFATTYTTTRWGFAVPYTAENPEAAVAFMNLLYTDSDLANLFVWGEEGVDWELNDEGFAQYVEGTDSSSYHSVTWATGSVLDLTPWEGGLTLEETEEVVENEEFSEYLGFVADTSDVEQEVTSCVNVVNEYYDALFSGVAGDETESMFQEMSEKLEAAGINDIVESYQTQLDEWLAEQ